MTHAAGFSLDLARCVGCGACVLACRIENQLPSGISWRRVLPLNLPRASGGPTYFLSVACHHCQDPPCAIGCPSGALKKREDGVVMLRSEACMGCRYCEMACPFGAPVYDAEAGLMTKCHLCHHRLDEKRPPACVAACPTEALGFEGGRAPVARPVKEPDQVPGFSDPAGAGPALSLFPPGGEIRSKRYGVLKAAVGSSARGSWTGSDRPRPPAEPEGSEDGGGS